MNRFLLLSISIVYSFTLSAQLPTIHAHTIIPASPAPGNHVKIVTHLETPNAAFLVDKLMSMSQKNIRLHLCYSHGMATVLTHHVDTFDIGPLPAGVYTVQLDAYMSSAGQHCARIDMLDMLRQFFIS